MHLYVYIYTYICAIFFAFKEVPWKHHEHHCRDEANSVFFAGSGDESWISFHFEAYGPSFVFVCCAICAMLGIIITVFCIDDRLGVFSISRNCSGHCICQSTEFMTLFWSCSERNDLIFGCLVSMSLRRASTSALGVVRIWWVKVRSAYHRHESCLVDLILLGLLWLRSQTQAGSLDMLCISYHSAFASWLSDAFSRFPYVPRDQGVAKRAVISCNAEAMILSVRCLGRHGGIQC